MLQENLKILSRAIERWTDSAKPVASAPPARELEKLLDLTLSDQPSSADELEASIMQYLDYSPNSADPEFYKLLYSGVNKPALLGDWLTSLTNSTMHTYQVGPVATLMELELIRCWNQLVGFDDGEGVMVSGGSQANLVGMMLARHQACPDFKAKGMSNNQPLVAYNSDQAHYSTQRSANVLGIGTDNLISIASDAKGRIDPTALTAAIEKDIAAGRKPFFLSLTAGTTVVGAYDDIEACSVIAKKYDLWLHIDGAWGAPVLFSEQHKHLLTGSHLADSFAWDAHKLMNVPITAAVILVNRKNALKDAIAGGGGDYLFHNDANAEYNLGERSLQCGRRADALKVWLSWKAIGNEGFANKINHLQVLKQNCLDMIEQNTTFELLAPAVYLNILFRYKPTQDLTEEQIGQLNITLCQRMRADGGPYVDYAHYKGRTGIRLILANDAIQRSGLERLLNDCERIGAELERELG